jgi:malonate-semialdehyde dehydrogenase (acetylating)/methylmalonate-semialdehyde dehydrogenase
MRPDAQGDVYRGLQVVETACGITSTLLGNKLEGACSSSDRDRVLTYDYPVSRGMDTENRKVPLGVCAR